MATLSIGLPRSDIDLYSDDVLRDPYPVYRELRDIGSAVWLTRLDMAFVGRFRDVRSLLGNWQTFSSAQGVGLNPVINAAWEEALICQDPPIHTERRKLMNEALGPVALKPVTETIEAHAQTMGQRLAAMGSFDAVNDFAHDLPINVVMDLIGWPQDVRPGLLDFAAHAWNAVGPANARMESGLDQLQRMMDLIGEIYDGDRILPGGFAAQLVDASRAGHITRETAIGMLAGYVVAAFESTIAAMASGIHLFALNPAEWDKFRANRSLATSMANEILRMESPFQTFSRVAVQDAEMSDGSVIPAGTRTILSYASANRDERQFSQPESFIIDRKEKQQLAFGHGPHGCAGQGLARMELTAVFSALADNIARFEIAGEPERALNNITRSFKHLPVRAIPA